MNKNTTFWKKWFDRAENTIWQLFKTISKQRILAVTDFEVWHNCTSKIICDSTCTYTTNGNSTLSINSTNVDGIINKSTVKIKLDLFPAESGLHCKKVSVLENIHTAPRVPYIFGSQFSGFLFSSIFLTFYSKKIRKWVCKRSIFPLKVSY